MTLRHILAGSFLGVVEQILRAAAALIITPVMVSALGVEDFSMWVLLVAYFGQFSLLDPGLQSALPRFLVAKDAVTFREVVSTAMAIYGIVALACLLVSWATWLVLPIFVNDSVSLESARWIVISMGAANVVGMLTRLPALHLLSQMRKDLISGVAIVRLLICTFVVFWLLLREKAGVSEVAFVHSIGTIIESLLLTWFGRSALASIRFSWISVRVARSLVGFSSWAYLITLCERLRLGLDGFILGWLRNSSAAGIYSLGARPVSMTFDTVYACIGTQLLPGFARLRENSNESNLHSAFIATTRLAAYLSAMAGGMVCILGPSFLNWWIPAQAAEASPVLLCLTLPLALQMTQVPAIHLLYAITGHRALALTQAVALALNILLSIIFAQWLGIVGAALGTMVDILLLHGVVMPILISRKAGIRPSQFFWHGQIVPFAACSLAFVVPMFTVIKWMPDCPTFWDLTAAGMAMLIWLSAWILGFRLGWQEMRELKVILE